MKKKNNFVTELNKKIVDAFLERLKSKRKYKWIDDRKKLFSCYGCKNDAQFVNILEIHKKLTVEDVVTGHYIIEM